MNLWSSDLEGPPQVSRLSCVWSIRCTLDRQLQNIDETHARVSNTVNWKKAWKIQSTKARQTNWNPSKQFDPSWAVATGWFSFFFHGGSNYINYTSIYLLCTSTDLEDKTCSISALKCNTKCFQQCLNYRSSQAHLNRRTRDPDPYPYI